MSVSGFNSILSNRAVSTLAFRQEDIRRIKQRYIRLTYILLFGIIEHVKKRHRNKEPMRRAYKFGLYPNKKQEEKLFWTLKLL